VAVNLKEIWRRVRHAIKDFFAGADGASEGGNHGNGQSCASKLETPQAAVATESNKQTNNPPSAMTAAAPALFFECGGVRASPKEDERCRISGLRMTPDGLSFRWEFGIPDDWKRGRDEGKGAMVLACAFRWDAARGGWAGGKFDWIDERRTTRDFKNIYDGYNGWSASAFFAAPKRAFCVVSADGKWRSNLLED
jgi:hypothetical protein